MGFRSCFCLGAGKISAGSQTLKFNELITAYSVCIIGFARLFSLLQTNLNDITCKQCSIGSICIAFSTNEHYLPGTNIPPGLWSTAEGAVGVMSANLPSLRPLFAGMAVKASSRLSANHSDPFENGKIGRGTVVKDLRSKTRGFERMGDSPDGQISGEGDVFASVVEAGWDDSNLEIAIPLQDIVVTTQIRQDIKSQESV